ncbi:MAG: V-type ATP synthase subunit I [Candidatus Aenigmarchaeota archaeon]|nr:V-type ATP synthase subunit I [Candidatus Aenigmarchaeota archaeon]
MFRPEKMREVYVLGLRKDREDILKNIQQLGTIHLKKTDISDLNETPSELIHDAVQSLEQIREIRKLFKDKKSIFGKKAEKVKIDETGDAAFAAVSKRYIGRIHKSAKDILKSENKLEDRRNAVEKKLDLLDHFRDADIRPESISDNRKFISGLGIVRKNNLIKIKDLCDYRIADETEEKAYIIFISGKDNWKKIHHIIDRFDTDEKSIRECAKDLRKDLEGIEKQITYTEECAKEIIKEKAKILAYEERWKNIKARLSKEKLLGRTEKTFVINGWIPSGNLGKLESIESIAVFEGRSKTEPPVKLDNPSFVKPFEKITRWFGLPKYGEIDPTMFIAVGFPIFFAIMLTDVAYGLILLAASVFAYFKTGDEDLKALAHILIISSAATVIAGLIFGSVFGNFWGFTSVLDALRDPITILKISLAIGLVHINLGLGLNLYSKIKEKSRDVLEPLSWIALEAGILAAIIGTETIQYIGYTAISLVFIYRLKDGITGFLSVPSFFGSWISYIRLMALAVATSWLQFVINMGVTAAAKVSIILAALVFVFGHLFNMSLNVVSAFVHSMRLHYVEFFEQFYESGGEEFTPLKNEKKYSG